MKQGIFVTGTDTGIGKTLVSSLLVEALVQEGRATGYFKPIQSGYDDDTAEVLRLSLGGARVQTCPPRYRFRAAQAPFRAAELEATLSGASAPAAAVDFDAIAETWSGLSDGHWVLEGAGGLLAPLNSTGTNRELIARLGMRAVLVASTRLGTINHTLLTVEAANRAGLEIAGLVLVGSHDPGLVEVIQRFSARPFGFVTEIPWVEKLEPGILSDLARSRFHSEVLRKIFLPV